jgi:hypothetical protein
MNTFRLTTFNSAKEALSAVVIRRFTSDSDCSMVWTSDESWFEFRQWQEAFRPVLSFTQPPIQSVQGLPSHELKRPGREADYSPHLVLKFNEWSYNSTPFYAIVAPTGTTLLYVSEQHTCIDLVYWFLFKYDTCFGCLFQRSSGRNTGSQKEWKGGV